MTDGGDDKEDEWRRANSKSSFYKGSPNVPQKCREKKLNPDGISNGSILLNNNLDALLMASRYISPCLDVVHDTSGESKHII
uniref:Uncharacterized protein n=1 Tax=Cucumis melo TaxID=3656 RepID=A0A9I9DNE8_CUCME